MSSNDFINTITNAQIASALVLVAAFLAIIAFQLTVKKNSGKSSKHQVK